MTLYHWTLQAAGPEHRQEYLSRVMCAFWELQAQEEARSAFTAHDQDQSEICKKIISVTRTVRLVNDRPYGVYICRSRKKLDPDSLTDVPVDGGCRFESLPYVGVMAYDRLTGRMVYDDMNPDTHQQVVPDLQQEIVYGEGIEYLYEWSEVAAYLPRLTAQHLTPEELRARVRRGRLWSHEDPDNQRTRWQLRKRKQNPAKRKTVNPDESA